MGRETDSHPGRHTGERERLREDREKKQSRDRQIDIQTDTEVWCQMGRDQK